MALKKIKQHDIKDCGAACLASIGHHHGIKLPISRIRQLANTDKNGTNVLGMIEAAEQMGFIAKGVNGDFNSLTRIPLPAVAHVIINKKLHHYVVIKKVTKKEIHVMDPGLGEFKSYRHDEFKEMWTGVLILIAKGEKFHHFDEKVSAALRFWRLVKPHKFVLLQALIGAIIFTILGLATSIYVQKVTDFVLVGGNRRLLNLMSFIMVFIIIFRLYIGTAQSIMVLKTGQLMDAQLILGYYKHLLNLPQRFFDTMQIGEITSRISDAVKIRAFINGTAIDMLVNIFTVFFAFALMFTFYWKLAAFVLLIIPFYLIIYFLLNRFNKKVERQLMEDAAELQTQLVESITHVRTVKEFGLQQFSNDKTEHRFIKLLFTGYKSGMNGLFAGNATSLLASLFTIILLWLGAGYVLDGEITTGELFSFYALIAYFTEPVASLVGSNKTIQNALIAADRLFEIMDLEREETNNKIEVKKEQLGDISFENVSFRYGTRTTVFQDFNALIKKGQTTAIVGESGSGKTTLIALLQNLYPIQNGKILLGNYDLKYVDYRFLRRLIGVIPQQIDLFSGTIIENIALGEVAPDMSKVFDLSKNLGILDFIENLPDGFETQVGENGAMLSGGQKQRIAIARALYKNPEILLMDEATSALDSHSETIVKKTIDDFKQSDKTVIVIAHRLSTIANADHIIVMERGKIVEQGTHQELITLNKKYMELWSKQSLVS